MMLLLAVLGVATLLNSIAFRLRTREAGRLMQPGWWHESETGAKLVRTNSGSWVLRYWDDFAQCSHRVPVSKTTVRKRIHATRATGASHPLNLIVL